MGAGRIAAGLALLLAVPLPALAQPAQIGVRPVELTADEYRFDSAEQHDVLVTPLVRGLARPFAFAVLPDGDLLIAERGGGLRLLRLLSTAAGKPLLSPTPIAGVPVPAEPAPNTGLHDIELHPDFSQNHWLYFTYNEPAPRPEGATTPATQRYAHLKLMRGKLEDGKLTQVETLLTGGVTWALGSRIAFGKDGKVYVTTGGAEGNEAQDLSTIYGKVLRLNPDGTAPADNPFIGREGANPAIFSYGHRDQHGLAIHPETGDVLNAEHGPNGGDEVNRILAGRNYGWPDHTWGRNYTGAAMGEVPLAEGIERPLVVWNPSIAPSGLLVYTGDLFPAWKGNLFVGSGRRGEVPGTGGLERVVLGANGAGDVRRETLLTQLHQRVRDVAQGQRGEIYVLTDGNENAVLRIEPTQ